MNFNGLRLEYALEGSLNYVAWKDQMEVVLEDNGLKEFIDNYIPTPATANAQNIVDWKNCVSKVRNIILEGVQDHIFSNLHGKETLYEMWKALKNLFKNSSDHKKLTLKNKMQRNKTIPLYLSRFTQSSDEVGKVGVTVAEDDLVSLALLGLPKSCHNYQDLVKGRCWLRGS